MSSYWRTFKYSQGTVPRQSIPLHCTSTILPSILYFFSCGGGVEGVCWTRTVWEKREGRVEWVPETDAVRATHNGVVLYHASHPSGGNRETALRNNNAAYQQAHSVQFPFDIDNGTRAPTHARTPSLSFIIHTCYTHTHTHTRGLTQQRAFQASSKGGNGIWGWSMI